MSCEKTETCSCNSDPTAALPEVLNLTEAAALLRVPAHTVYYLLEHGLLKGRRVGKAYRFRRTALLAWLDGNERTAA